MVLPLFDGRLGMHAAVLLPSSRLNDWPVGSAMRPRGTLHACSTPHGCFLTNVLEERDNTNIEERRS